MVKKILITGLVLTAILYSGYSYFQSSALKHEQFLLEQSLFPEFTQKTQAAQIPARPIRTVLKDSEFQFIVSTTESTPELRENFRNQILLIVQNWQSTQDQFNSHSVSVFFADEILNEGAPK